MFITPKQLIFLETATRDERRDAYFLKTDAIVEHLTFDTALPQMWVNDVVEKTGSDPRGHFVWLYQDKWDGPCPTTPEGSQMLTDYWTAINLGKHNDS